VVFMPEREEPRQKTQGKPEPIRLGGRPEGPAGVELLMIVKRGLEEKSLERARELIERHGAEPDFENIYAARPLHYATGLKDEARARAFVEMLLAHGAKPGPMNNEGEKPADIARRTGHAKLAALLDVAEQVEKI